MAILSVLADPILPVFAIMAFGFGMGRMGRTSVGDARQINRFAMTVLVPILVFDLVLHAPIRSFSPVPVLIYALAEAGVFAAGFALARRVFGRGRAESVLLAFAGIFANNVFFVLPMARLIFGEGHLLPITAVVTLDSTVTFGCAMAALQIIRLGQVSVGTVAASLIRTPLLQALVLGLAMNLFRLTVPPPVQTFLDFNGVAAAPVALFALGVVLSQTPLRPDVPTLTFTGIKLLVFPALIWAGLAVATPGDAQAHLFLLAAAGPAGTMAFSMALLHDVRTDVIARVIIYTSVLTLGSLAVLSA